MWSSNYNETLLVIQSSFFVIMAHEPILSVSDITRTIQIALDTQFENIVVLQGEISNYKHHSSGHRYFTLKDATAQLGATMWRSTPIHFQPRDGMSVIVSGKITMFAPQGKVQIECRTMRPVGQGDLYLAFERLKQELAGLGYFDSDRKRSLPAFPTRIGIATSITGAAIRDVLATLARRMPLCEAIVRPTIVQGESAAEDIAHAIADLCEAHCDVLIVGRGGGSIEDLWAFNTALVAQAIYESPVPIISAVGHETDFTIADFVADVRAATPTAAAELAVRDIQELSSGLDGIERTMSNTMRRSTQDAIRRLQYSAQSISTRSIMRHLQTQQQRIDTIEDRIQSSMERFLAVRTRALDSAETHLSALAPLAPLQRGFALLEKNGHTLHHSDTLQPHDVIMIRRMHDTLPAVILDTNEHQIKNQQVIQR
jgi:exodeoxyribonuclease VII large subunit